MSRSPLPKWLDGFSLALPVAKARVPLSVLKLLALGGEVVCRIGELAPLALGRIYRMITVTKCQWRRSSKLSQVGCHWAKGSRRRWRDFNESFLTSTSRSDERWRNNDGGLPTASGRKRQNQ